MITYHVFLSYSHFVREHQFEHHFRLSPVFRFVSYPLALNWKHVPNWCFWPKDYFKTSYFLISFTFKVPWKCACHLVFIFLSRYQLSFYHCFFEENLWRKLLILSFFFLSLVLISFLCNIYVHYFNIIHGFTLSRTWYLQLLLEHSHPFSFKIWILFPPLQDSNYTNIQFSIMLRLLFFKNFWSLFTPEHEAQCVPLICLPVCPFSLQLCLTSLCNFRLFITYFVSCKFSSCFLRAGACIYLTDYLILHVLNPSNGYVTPIPWSCCLVHASIVSWGFGDVCMTAHVIFQ